MALLVNPPCYYLKGEREHFGGDACGGGGVWGRDKETEGGGGGRGISAVECSYVLSPFFLSDTLSQG